MSILRRAVLLAAAVVLCLLPVSCGQEQVQTADSEVRIVTLGGSITEIVFALGAGHMVVGTDLSSTYPDTVQNLPRVGYWRTLSAEGVLSLQPSLVFADHEAGPASALQQIEQAGISVHRITAENTPAGVKNKITTIAALIGKTEEGRQLADRVEREYTEARAVVDALPSRPRTLFLYMRGSSVFSAGGANTHADAMIRLCGGDNAAAELDGMKPVAPEFFVHSRPDVLIVTRHGIESAGGIEQLRQRPGLASTPAVQAGRIVVVDDLAFLGFGPRMPEAIRQVAGVYADMVSQAGAMSAPAQH